MEIAAFGLPDDGDKIVCGNYVYEWDEVEEVDEFRVRWGWSLICHVADAATVHGIRESLPVFSTLPQYN